MQFRHPLNLRLGESELYLFPRLTMPNKIFNANPTIYAPSKPYTRTSNLGNGRSLWIGDAQDVEDDSDEVEPIDQDEIFGTDPSRSRWY